MSNKEKIENIEEEVIDEVIDDGINVDLIELVNASNLIILRAIKDLSQISEDIMGGDFFEVETSINDIKGSLDMLGKTASLMIDKTSSSNDGEAIEVDYSPMEDDENSSEEDEKEKDS